MARRVLSAAIVSLLVMGSWFVGRAQTEVAEFEVSIELQTPPGAVSVACYRGCDWAERVEALKCDSQDL